MKRDLRPVYRYKCCFYVFLNFENGKYVFVDIADGECIYMERDDLKELEFVRYDFI